MCYKHELARYKGIVEEKLFAIVDGCGAPKDLKSAMRYSLGNWKLKSPKKP